MYTQFSKFVAGLILAMADFFRVLTAASLAIVLVGSAMANPADTYPQKSVTLIVPFPAANVSDLLARAIAERLTKVWGQTVIVENVVGGSGIVGLQKAARAVPDGYTIALATTGAGVIVPMMHPSPPYDLLKDFAPITLAAPLPFILLVHPSVPANSLRELLEMARREPGKLSYASLGTGSAPHLAMEILKTMAKVDMVHVPYRGSAQASMDLLANRVQVMFDTVPPALPRIRSGELRALAVSGAQRTSIAPEIPTMAEAGIPGYDAIAWTGFVAPAGTPQPILDKLNAELVRILKSPDVKEILAARGVETIGSSQTEFSQYIRSEQVKWGDVLRSTGASLQK